MPVRDAIMQLTCVATAEEEEKLVVVVLGGKSGVGGRVSISRSALSLGRMEIGLTC